MKTPILILLNLLFGLNMIAQNADNKQDPFRPFNLLRAAWENNQDIYTTQRQIEKDSITVDPRYRDYYGQALMTILTWNGDIQGKDSINLRFRTPRNLLAKGEPLADTLSIMNAKSFLLEKSKDHQIVMINEAHLYPQHRAFMAALLPELYQQGFRHLFLEALSNDTLQTYPTRKQGMYVNEPTFANLVRSAIQSGFYIHAYDGYYAANRDSVSARNIIEKSLASHPTDKIVVFCGFGHNNENDKSSVASYLKDMTGIDPLTVDQTIYSEPETSSYYQSLIEYYGIMDPVILVNAHTAIPLLNVTGQDYYVISSPTFYLNGYPTWQVNNKKTQWIENDFLSYDIVEVYYEEEFKENSYAIPFSIKRHEKSRDRDYLLVPLIADFTIVYYKCEDDYRRIVKIQ